MTTQRKIAGVMGWPIEHSLSPRLHGYWLKKYGIDGDYVMLPVPPDELGATLKSLPEKGFSGVNLTVPHKEAAMGFVNDIDIMAKNIGAINTVVVLGNGRLMGRNTDIYGFSENLKAAGFQATGGVATVFGAGGAARACVAALASMEFKEIRLVNRTRNRAEKLAADLNSDKIRVMDWDSYYSLENTTLLVNTTSLGMKGLPPLDVALDLLPKEAWVTDIVYTPLMTPLLKNAAARGNKVVDGLGMLLHQARPAFEAFFGVDPEVTPELRAHVLAALEGGR